MSCPAGWVQKYTADGEPFCYNNETGNVEDDNFREKDRVDANLEATRAGLEAQCAEAALNTGGQC
jgi:hypothetical protein